MLGTSYYPLNHLDSANVPSNTPCSMPRYIYFVGKPYPHTKALDTIRGSGYKIGLFLDKNVNLRNRGKYDSVIELDFSTPETMMGNLAGKNIRIDGLVCTYENYIVAKSRLAEHFKVAAPSLASAQASTDKLLMRQAFMHADPAMTPNFGLASSENELLGHARHLSYPLILKPTNLVKSLLVLRCNKETELLSNFAYAKGKIAELYKKHKVYGRDPQLIVEEYMEGKTCSIAAFVDKNGTAHFCDGIVSLTNAQDIGADDNYIYGRFLPAQFNKDLELRLFETARKGIAALKMSSTPAHVELIYNDKEVKLIEIGARIGGYRPRMYAISYGLDLIAQEIKLALGQTPDLSGNFQAHCGVYELFPKAKGTFLGIDGKADTSQFAYYRVKAKKGDLIGPAKNGYKAAAVAIVSSPDEQEFSKICETVSTLQARIK